MQHRTNLINTLAIIALVMLPCSLTQDLNSQTDITSSSFLQSETSETFERDWMKGFWIGKGYGCGGRSNIPEDINVEFVGDEFVATKENGDDCVPSGKVTFRGKIPEKWDTTKSYPGTITLGSPSNPASGHGNCNVVPVEKDKFRVGGWNLEFVRGRLHPPAPVVPAPVVPEVVTPAPVAPVVVAPVVVAPVVQKPNKVQPCNHDDHLPRGDDNENIYTKHIDVVERFRKGKNPYRKFRGALDNEDDLVLVPRKWLKVPSELKGRRNNRRRNNRRRNNRRNDMEDKEDNDDDDEEPRRHRRGKRCNVRREKRDRLEN